MRIDQAGNRGDAVGIDGLVGGLIQTVADGLNQTVFNENRIRLPKRTFQFARDQRADVFDQDRSHNSPTWRGTISKCLWV